MFPTKQRGIANGIFSWGVYLGYGVSFLFGIYLTKLDVLGYGWRSTYVLASIPGLSVALTLLLVEEPRDSVKAPAPAPALTVRRVSLAMRRMSEVSRHSVRESIAQSQSYTRLVLSSFSTPAMILLFFAAAVRHTGRDGTERNKVRRNRAVQCRQCTTERNKFRRNSAVQPVSN